MWIKKAELRKRVPRTVVRVGQSDGVESTLPADRKAHRAHNQRDEPGQEEYGQDAREESAFAD